MVPLIVLLCHCPGFKLLLNALRLGGLSLFIALTFSVGCFSIRFKSLQLKIVQIMAIEVFQMRSL